MKSGLRVVAAALVLACTEQTGPVPVPARPTDLQVALMSPGTAHLTWKAGSQVDGDLTYSVYQNDVKVGTTATTEFTDTPLAGNTTHTWFVTARSLAGGVSAPSDPVVLSLGDNEAPKTVSNTPANAASGISRLPAPSVTFSEPMIPATINAATMVATITATGAIVYGTVSYDPSSRTADFWPLSFLPAGTNITVTAGTGVRDVAGNGLASPFSFSFTTGNSPASVAELPASTEPILIAQRVDPDFGPMDIFKLRTDGGGKVNVSNHPSGDFDGAWSPDGRHIAFSSDRNGNLDIFMMREDGKGLRRLATDLADESQPRWSPDARRIVYRSRKDEVAPGVNYFVATDIFAMNADGTQQVNLTKSPGVFDEWPSWSPDGQRLLYTRTDVLCCSPRIMVANADGTGAVPLRASDPRFQDDVASWSPDGRQIAFSVFDRNSPMFQQDYRLFLIDPDGANPRQITFSGGQRFPSWSPDGGMLVYSFSWFDEFWGRFGKIDVRTFDLAKSKETVLTPNFPTSQTMSPQAWRR